VNDADASSLALLRQSGPRCFGKEELKKKSTHVGGKEMAEEHMQDASGGQKRF